MMKNAVFCDTSLFLHTIGKTALWRNKARILLLMWPLMALVLSTSPALQAADELVTFETTEQRELYFSLLKEYRCLKCQNQNLSDSHASLASDLRREIREQV